MQAACGDGGEHERGARGEMGRTEEKVHNPHTEAHQLCTYVWHGERDPLVVRHLDLGIRTEGASKLAYFNS